MNTAEQMSALAGHLLLCGWEHNPHTRSTYTHIRHPEYTVHLAPVGEVQVNEKTAGGATLRLLVLRVTGAVAAIAALHALDVIDGVDLLKAQQQQQQRRHANLQDLLQRCQGSWVAQDTTEPHEAVSGPHSGPQDPPEAQEPAS